MAKGLKRDCKRDRLWVRFSLQKMKYLIFLFPRTVTRQSAAFISSTQHTILLNSAESGKWNGSVLMRMEVPSAYPGMCRLQREEEKLTHIYSHIIVHKRKVTHHCLLLIRITRTITKKKCAVPSFDYLVSNN